VSLIYEVYISENYDGKIPFIDDDKIYKVKDSVFSDVKDTKTTQGIVALVKISDDYNDIEKFVEKIHTTNAKNNNILILDNIQDPGNLGTMLRTAEASGTNNIMLVNNCVDVYSPKVVRSSMSAITRLNIYKSIDHIKDIKYIKDKKYSIIGTFLDGKKMYANDMYEGDIAVVIGNEANGISDEVKYLCDKKVSIPMSGKIESLNASIACAIILYEVRRQNEFVC
ncbi:MAG: RNA methyltransferase, partial [Lachnospiraceae bacterium]|nr:RNA methyltransferase [Lachnospiraceae bacterium]